MCVSENSRTKQATPDLSSPTDVEQLLLPHSRAEVEEIYKVIDKWKY